MPFLLLARTFTSSDAGDERGIMLVVPTDLSSANAGALAPATVHAKAKARAPLELAVVHQNSLVPSVC